MTSRPAPAFHVAAAAMGRPVADGRSTLSQRKLLSIEKHARGLEPVASMAKNLGVHLVQLTDDKGQVLVAASRHTFKVIA